MAFIALYAAGSALLPAALGVAGSTAIAGGLTVAGLGGAIGGAFGSILDSQFTMPAIFGSGTPSVTGPRLSSLKVTSASEGAAKNRIWGPRARVPGQIIWQTDLEEVPTHHSSGGKGGGGGGDSETFDYYWNCAVSFGRKLSSTGRIVKILADSKVIYDATDPGNVKVDSRCDAIRTYIGGPSQAPDSLIQTHVGSGDTPAYRQDVYAVIERLWLRDWGNRPPNLTAIIQERDTLTVAQLIVEMCALVGIESDRVDVSRVQGACRGYYTNGPMTMKQQLEPLMMAFDLAVQDNAGVLTFIKRGWENVVDIPDADMAAHEDGEEAPDRLQLEDAPARLDGPRRVSVEFTATDNGYQIGAESATRPLPSTYNTVTVSVPVTMERVEAKRLASKLMWTSWTGRVPATMNVGPRHMLLQPGDVVRRGARTFMVDERTRGVNGVVELQTRQVDQRTYRSYAISGTYVNDDPTVIVTGDVVTRLLDLPPLKDSDCAQSGLYGASCLENPDRAWRGVRLYSSPTGDEYGLVASQPIEGTIGVTETALDDWDGTPAIDYASTVDVQLYDGVLESASVDEVAAGANRVLIGNELMAFCVATPLTGTKRYRLSQLFHGLKDTPTTGHVVGERVVLLDDGPLAFAPLPTSLINVARTYKAVPFGQQLADATPFSATCAGRTLTQLAPCHLASTPSGADTVVSWKRRTRGGSWFLGDVQPLYHSVEQYRVEIRVSSMLKRTVEVTGASQWTYTAAMKTADGASSTFELTVSQLGPIGYGNEAVQELSV